MCLGNFLFAGRVWFVHTNTNCEENCFGTSWSTALNDLQDALLLAQPNDSIWVAQGRYFPSTLDRDMSFNIPDSVAVFGGFAGWESSVSERLIEQYPTILDGNIGQLTDRTDNTRTIVLFENVSQAAILDGFIIQNGYADLSEEDQSGNGAGIFNWSNSGGTSSPTIRNCVIQFNTAIHNGGGMYNDSRFGTCMPALDNCQWIANTARFGGGLYNNANLGVCQITYKNCQFIQNEAFANAQKRGTGGALYNFARKEGTIDNQFFNCLFWENIAFNGAGYYGLTEGVNTNASFINCTFVHNQANVGGTIYLNVNQTGNSRASIANCIIWNSESAFDPHFHFSGQGSPQVTITNTIIDAPNCPSLTQSSAPILCANKTVWFNINPQFVNTNLGDFHLKDSSPALDAGEDQFILDAGIQTDFEGDPRRHGRHVDLGYDENQTAISFTNYRAQYQYESIENPWPLAIAPIPNLQKQPLNVTVLDHHHIQLINNHGEGFPKMNYQLWNMAGQFIQGGQITINQDATPLLLKASLPSGAYTLQLENRAQPVLFFVGY